MDKKLFDSLDEPLKEKIRNCKNDAEMQKIITNSGMQELSVDMLEGVSGGNGPCIHNSESRTKAVKARDLSYR